MHATPGRIFFGSFGIQIWIITLIYHFVDVNKQVAMQKSIEEFFLATESTIHSNWCVIRGARVLFTYTHINAHTDSHSIPKWNESKTNDVVSVIHVNEPKRTQMSQTHTDTQTKPTYQRRANFMRYFSLASIPFIPRINYKINFFLLLLFRSFVRSFDWFHLSIQTSSQENTLIIITIHTIRLYYNIYFVLWF